MDRGVTNEDLKFLVLEQFQDLKADLQTTRTDLRKEMSELREEIDDRNVQIVSLKGDLRNVQSDLDKVYAKVAVQQDEIDMLKLYLDELEQHGRHWALRISGLDLPVKDTFPDYCEIVVKLASEIKVDLKLSDIDRAHPVGGSKNMIIVKFTNYTARSLLYDARCKLKGRMSAVYINEDLTRTRFAIFKSLLHLKKVYAVWSRDGRIFTSVNNTRMLIKSMADVSKLDPPDVNNPSE
jgi:hypothetical protein